MADGCIIDRTFKPSMKTFPCLSVMFVFTATSLVADIGSAEMPMVTIAKTQKTMPSVVKKNDGVSVPWWMVVGLLAWVIVDGVSELARYRETND